MTQKEKIICELEKENYLSDRELANRIYGINAPQQSINQVCRKLAVSGQLKRTSPPIKNYIPLCPKSEHTAPVTKVPAITSTQAISQVSNLKKITTQTKSVYLKDEFNNFWNSFWKTKGKDYFSEMPLTKLVRLKMAVANINNLITNEVTMQAVKIIGDILGQSSDEVARILQKTELISANRNGYDIEWSGTPAYICEVKANLPVNGTAFGAAQRQQIEKDIYGLMNGKTKSTIQLKQLCQYYKFLCMYQEDDNVIQAIERLLVGLDAKTKQKVKLYQAGEKVSLDTIYVIFAKLDNGVKL